MSNRICGRCKSSVVIPYGQTALFKCQNCSALGYQSEFPEKTVFDKLTASPEVLAEKLVFILSPGLFTSHIIDTVHESWKYAYAATVTRLKEQAQ